jgi:hypothetical protein
LVAGAYEILSFLSTERPGEVYWLDGGAEEIC